MIGTLCERADPKRPAPVQIVLLPAAYSGPEDFCKAGFGAAVRARGLNVDVTFAALDVGHVTDRSVVPRVLAEVIAPLRAAAAQLWLGGISLGGYVALCCAEAEPQGLAGLCLFAPYLGSHIIISEVAAGRDPGVARGRAGRGRRRAARMALSAAARGGNVAAASGAGARGSLPGTPPAARQCAGRG